MFEHWWQQSQLGIRVKFWDHVKVGGCTLRGNDDVRSGGDIGG